MDEKSVNESIATQVAVLTFQSRLSASNATNTSVHQEQQMAHFALQQQLMQENMHHLIAGLNIVTLNQSEKDVVWAVSAPVGTGADTMAGTEAKQGATKACVAIAVVYTVNQSLEDFPPSRGSLSSLEAHRDFNQAACPREDNRHIVLPQVASFALHFQGAPSSCNGASPTIFKNGKTSHKLECLLLMWLQSHQRSHKHDMPFPHA